MEIRTGKVQAYIEWHNNNLDPYGHACFTFAERWADLLEKKIKSCKTEPMQVIIENAEETSRAADTEGITGFMYGCAVSILAECWEYGEELRKWHNKEYDYKGARVVNPAIMTIG